MRALYEALTFILLLPMSNKALLIASDLGYIAGQDAVDFKIKMSADIVQVPGALTHFRLNKPSHTKYWKNRILILGMSGYVISKRYSKRKLAICKQWRP